MSEVELILSKLKIVSEEQEKGMYLCDKEHSKMLLDYITNLQQEKDSFEKIANQNYKVAEDYKSRNEKAIEEIELYRNRYTGNLDRRFKGILDKLQGSDKE